MSIEKLKIPIRIYGESTPVAPDTNAEVAKINELVAAVNAGLATSNAIVGGDKYVRYLSSQTYGVPADALTLERLDPSTIIPGTEATVINPHPRPLTDTAPSAYYRATIVPAGTTGAVLVPAFVGSTDMVPIAWVEVVSNDTFTPLLDTEVNPGKGDYAGLDQRPLLIALVNAAGTGSSTVVTTPATTAPPTGPTVTGFLPVSAAVGASVTITGTAFTKATAVTFNGVPASFQAVNTSTIVATVPVGATTGTVAVANSAGTARSTATFKVSVAATTPTTPGAAAFAGFTTERISAFPFTTALPTNYENILGVWLDGLLNDKPSADNADAPHYTLAFDADGLATVGPVGDVPSPIPAGTSIIYITTTAGSGSSTSSLAVSVNAQRLATISPAVNVNDYDYQFRPAPTVDAQRQADMSLTLNAGESVSDYEYQTRS